MKSYGSCKGFVYRDVQKPFAPDPPGLKAQWEAQQAGRERPDGMSPTMKECAKCGKLLPLESFRRDSRRSDGRKGVCAECMSEQDRRRRKASVR